MMRGWQMGAEGRRERGGGHVRWPAMMPLGKVDDGDGEAALASSRIIDHADTTTTHVLPYCQPP
jgi:hypothetical protein